MAITIAVTSSASALTVRPLTMSPITSRRLVSQTSGITAKQRFHEARTSSLAGVAVQGELAHHQQSSSRLLHRAIHLPLVVGEEAERGDLVGHPRHPLHRVVVGEADQEEEPTPDRPRAISIVHWSGR